VPRAKNSGFVFRAPRWFAYRTLNAVGVKLVGGPPSGFNELLPQMAVVSQRTLKQQDAIRATGPQGTLVGQFQFSRFSATLYRYIFDGLLFHRCGVPHGSAGIVSTRPETLHLRAVQKADLSQHYPFK
jgi:hypothetical protein